MIRLDTTTRKLQVVLLAAVASAQSPVVSSWSDATTSAYGGGSTPINTNSTTAVDIVAAPAASTVRDVDYINIRNEDTAAITVTVRLNDNGTSYTLTKATLSIGDQLTYTHASGWKIMDSAGNAKQTATGIGTGTHALWLPASAGVSRTTNGATYVQSEWSTNKTMKRGYSFSLSTSNYIQFSLGAPTSWDKGTITAKFVWEAAASDANDVVWQIAGASMGDGDSVDAARGTFIAVTDGAGNTSPGQVRISPATAAITIAGSPATDDHLVLEVLRDPAHGSDTSTNDAVLLGVWLYFNYTQLFD